MPWKKHLKTHKSNTNKTCATTNLNHDETKNIHNMFLLVSQEYKYSKMRNNYALPVINPIQPENRFT
ncbi:protein of unknown function [Shewanella benthica]|uniref:Uncharacterized protein n=1 Tax=Shewanella benthica TaxID=43661 RepID=A0A330M0N7_9GAMM|nr:protein of unknown function [Shewanella benthica]